MGFDLSNAEQNRAVALFQQDHLGEVLKPLIREIYLFDSYVAGTMHLKDPSVLDEIEVDDPLTLLREENKYDENAILVLTADRKKLGYVPEKDNIVFARLMDAGKILKAKIRDIRPKDDYFTMVSIGLYLVDL